jgi:DNA-binding transcriptional LysR family regulator
MSSTMIRTDGGPASPGRSSLVAAPHGEVNLAGVDLNLLVALDALLRSRNVTHAGHQVGLSQPAMSRALARLRALFHDDLLVRTPKGLVPTRRADRLAEALPPILHQLRDMISTRPLLPHEWQTKVTIAMPDHQALVLLPRLRERAPHLDLVTDPFLAGALKRLEQGEIDFAVGQIGEAPSGTYLRRLYSDRFVGLLRRDHPALSAPPTAEGLAALRCAVVFPGGDQGLRQIYDSLTKLELPDRAPVMVPNVMTACMMVAEVDLMLTVPSRVAQRAAAMLPLAMVELPFELPAYEVSLIWHERRHRDPEHRWMRAEMTAASLAAV